MAGTSYKVFNATYSPGVRETATFPVSARILKDVIRRVLCKILCFIYKIRIFLHGSTAVVGQGLTITEASQSRSNDTALCRTPLDEWWTQRRDLYLTTHNRQTPMPPAGFEPAILESVRPQTCALDHSATRIGTFYISVAMYGDPSGRALKDAGLRLLACCHREF